MYSKQELAATAIEPDELMPDPAVYDPCTLARVIAQGHVIGFFNGPSEIGPRGLGGRSIFADPRRIATKERINREIKQRHSFRPLAPIVLADYYSDYFEPAVAANPYMLIVATAKEQCCRAAPAVVYIDGSVRVQAVESDGDPFLIALLTAFRKITGLPMLVNTSFRCCGEPVVETPTDAIRACVALGLDGLWLQDRYFAPPLPGARWQRGETAGDSGLAPRLPTT
jgi:carbamoyltransferase